MKTLPLVILKKISRMADQELSYEADIAVIWGADPLYRIALSNEIARRWASSEVLQAAYPNFQKGRTTS